MLSPAEIDAIDISQPEPEPSRSLAGKILSPQEIDSIPDQEPPARPRSGLRSFQMPQISEETLRRPSIADTTHGGRPLQLREGPGVLEEAEQGDSPIMRAVAGTARMAGRTLGMAGSGVAAGAEDIAEAPAQVAGYQQGFRNLRSLGRVKSPLDVIGGTEKPVGPTPFEEETKQVGPIEATARGALSTLAKDVPKFALLPLAGESLAAQTAAAGGLFGMDDQGEFHPKQALVAALLPGVGKAARLGTASIVGRAAAAGFKSLENPTTQKVLEEVGHQVALDGYMAASSAPELVDQYKKDPTQAAATLGGIMFQNLGFALLGAKRFQEGVPSDTQNWIHEKAEQMANDAIKARIVQDYTGPQLKEIYRRVNSDAPDVTPDEQNLVKFINSELGKGQSQAIKRGVRVTTNEADYENLPEFWKKYVPKAAGPKQSVSILGEEQGQAQPQPQTPTPGAAPQAGPRALLPKEIDAINTVGNEPGVPPERGGTVQQQQEQAAGEAPVQGADTGNRVPSAEGQPPTEQAPVAPPIQPAQPPVKPKGPEFIKTAEQKQTELPATMDTARKVSDMSADDLISKVGAFNKINIDIGKNATPEEYEELKRLRDKAQKRMEDSMKAVGELDKAKEPAKYEKALREFGALSNLPQFYNEAIKSYEEARKTGEPTPGQREAGNYPKRKINVHGMEISVENEAGSIRRSKPGAPPWEVTMPAAYGYIKGTTDNTGEQVDTYLGPNLEGATQVFVIDQWDPATRKFDEPKAMMGFNDTGTAVDAYRRSFSDQKGLQRIGAVTPLSIEQFKEWLKKPVELKGKAPGALKQPVGPEGKGGVRVVQPPAPERAASDLAGMSEDELDSLLDQAETETKPAAPSPKAPEAPKAPKAPRKPSGRSLAPRAKPAPAPPASPPPAPPEKSAADIIAEAAKAGITGADEAIKGLHKLFGGGKHMGIGPTFDEKTYEEAKPHFEKAYEEAKKAGKSLKDFLAWVFREFGERVRPYIKRFIQELQARKTGSTVAPSANQHPEGAGGGRGPGTTEPATTGATGEGVQAGAPAEGPGAGVQPPVSAPNAGPATGQGSGGPGAANANAGNIPAEQEPQAPQPPAGEPGSGAATEVSGQPAVPAPLPELGATGPKNLHLTENPAPTALAARANANIDAIELLKKLEAENRQPTEDERMVLAKWSGWGSFKELFNEGRAERKEWDPSWVKSYGKRYDRLTKLLTPKEFAAAAESSVNAHYSDPKVAVPMWDLAKRLGYKGGRTLESSAGSGIFLGFQPKEMAEATQWTAIEMEPISARILGLLYPEADTRSQPFEDAKVPNGYYELAIGNVPFGDVGPGREYPDLNLHNYFIARMLDKVRPGGLVITITSANTMESQPEQRKLLAGKAQLVGAIRLPSNAFEKSAGTEVVTDIMVFRKPDGTPFNGQPWLNKESVTVGEGREETEHPVNQYFVAHPEMVLGEHSLTGTMYRAKSYTVIGKGDLSAKINEAISKFPENIVQQEAQGPATLQTQLEDFTLMVDEKGHVVEAQGFKLGPPTGWDPTSKTLVDRAKRYIKLRDRLVNQYALERSKDATGEQVEENRKALKALYDAWVRKEGYLNTNARKTDHLRTDPNYYTVMGLEFVKEVADPENPGKTETVVEPADVLRERVIPLDHPPEKVDNATEALAVSMSYRGRMDTSYMKGLTGLTDDQIEAELCANGLAFKDPETSMLQTSNEYLSGDVRDKLAKAMFAAKESTIFQRNVESLRAAIPDPVPFERIAVSLPARWTPVPVLNTFAFTTIGLPQDCISWIPGVEQFQVRPSERRNLTSTAVTQWSTEAMDADDLLEHALNFKRATVKKENPEGRDKAPVVDEQGTALANQIIDRMHAEFENWLRTTKQGVEYRYFDPDRGQYVTEQLPIWDVMEREYNKRFNSFVEPKNDGSVLKLPGLALWVRRTPHLVNGVMRGLMNGSAVFGHGVGSGKTLLGIVLGRELQRCGLARKFVHVVKKPTVDQWRVTIERAYPGSKVLIPAKKDFEPVNRKKLLARMASGKWDFIVLTHEQFKSVPPGDQQIQEFYDEQITQLRQILQQLGADPDDVEGRKSTRGMSPAVRNVVKKLKTLRKSLDKAIKAKTRRLDQLKQQLESEENPIEKERIRDAIARQQRLIDRGLPWEDIGVDGLFVDESHNYKKMPINTEMENIKGIPNDFSQRAVDMLIKLRNVQARTTGRNVFFASGTPVSNSLAELWVMFHATNPNLLKAFSIETFDAFASAFASVETNFECGWNNRFKDVTRMAKFRNPSGLTMLTRMGMDVRMGNKELGLDVPDMEGGKPIMHTVKPTRAFQEWLAFLNQASDWWDGLAPKDRFFNSWVPVTIMRAGVAAALDPRLLFPTAEDDPNSKVNQAVRVMLDEWARGKDRRTTMMVFADMYRTMNTEKLMGALGGNTRLAAGATTEIEASVTPAEISDPEVEQETDRAAAQDEDDYVKNAVGSFNLYNDIRAKLIAAGVPEHEIAIITEHDSDSKRDKLFNQVRAGQVRILIGSTEKIGEGVDVPQRMSSQIVLDPPMQMTAAKQEQRTGRMIRQGNLHSPKNWNLPVRQHMFASERSMDAAIYQLLETKAVMVLQCLKGQNLGDSFDDPASELTMAMAEMKALATGDNRALELAKLTKEVRDLNAEEGAYLRRMSELRRAIDNESRNARNAMEKAGDYRRVGASAAAATAEGTQPVLLHVKSGDRIRGEEEIKAWLKGLQKKMADAVPNEKDSVGVSLIFGDSLRCRASMVHRVYARYDANGVGLAAEHKYEADAVFYLGGPEPEWNNARWDSSLTTMDGIWPALKRLPVNTEERAKKLMVDSAKSEEVARASTDQLNSTTFDKADLLNQKQAQLFALQSSMRGPQATPWDLMVREAGTHSPPLHVKLISEMQRLQPQHDRANEIERQALERMHLANLGNDAAEAANQQAIMVKAGDVADSLSRRLEDLHRRLSIVEKARLGSANAGELANVPYGATPRRGGFASLATAPGTEGADVINTKGIEQLRSLLRSGYSGLSPDATRLALAFLNEPVMQNMDWSKLQVAIGNFKGSRQFQGMADVSNSLLQLAGNASPETLPHELAHFMAFMLSGADRAHVEDLRLAALDKLASGLPPGPERDAAQSFLESAHGGMTSVGFMSLWQRISEQFPGADLRALRSQLYRLSNLDEYIAHMVAEEFSARESDKTSETWFQGLINQLRRWWNGALRALKKLWGQRPDMEQVIDDLLKGKYRNSPEAGYREAMAQTYGSLQQPDPVPPQSAGLPMVNVEIKGEAEKALEEEEARPRQTRVFDRVDTILGREGLGPAQRMAGAAHAASVFAKSGLQVEQQPNGLWKLADEGFESEVEGRRLLSELQKEISNKNQETSSGQETGYLGNLLNSVVENMTADRVTAFSPQLRRDLYAVAQGERSQRGLELAALAGMSNTVKYVGRNVDVVLHKTYSDSFGGELVRTVVQRIASGFRDYMTEAEIESVLRGHPQIADLMDRMLAMNRRDEGGRVYRLAQQRLKPKGKATVGRLEADARVSEAVRAILQQLKGQGIEPPENPNKPLKPVEQLLLMVNPKTVDKINGALRQALEDAERNAGIKAALMNAEDEGERRDLTERFSAGEEPSPEDVEEGLSLPEYEHWRVFREGLVGYSPVTVKLVEKLLRSDFKGTRFALPPERRLDTRLDLEKLAKAPQDETRRVIEAYLGNLERAINLRNATDATRQAVVGQVERMVTEQLEAARARVREPLFQPPKDPRAQLTPEQRIGQLINAGLFGDERLDLAEYVQRVASKGPVQKLLPKTSELIKAALDVPFYRQGEIPSHFADELTSRFGIPGEQADHARQVFATAFEDSFARAREKALENATKSLTPVQRRDEASPKKPLWKRIVQAANAGVFDTSAIMAGIASDHGFDTDPRLTDRMKALAEQLQRLEDVTPAETAAAAGNPEAMAKAKEVRMAATFAQRMAIRKQIEVTWAKLTRPINLRQPWATGQNLTAAVNDFLTGNMLLLTGYPLRLGTHVMTQVFSHIPSRAIAEACLRYIGDRDAGRETRLWMDMATTLRNGYTDVIKAFGEAAKGFRQGFAGRTEGRNVDRLLSSVQGLERLKATADEYWENGDYTRAALAYLFSTARISLKITQGLDAFQGTLIQAQEERQVIVSLLRENGANAAEAEVRADQILQDTHDAMPEAAAEITAFHAANGTELAHAHLDEAARELTKQRMFSKMAEFGLPPDAFADRLKLLRRVNAWQERTTTGLGGLVAGAGRGVTTLLEQARIPIPFTRFANAMGTGINYMLMHSPLYATTAFRLPGSKPSPWFRTPTDRMQRRVQAVMGSLFGVIGLMIAASGAAIVRLKWPTDKRERELLQASGHRLGTVEFIHSDPTKFTPISLSVGLLSLIAPYMAAGGAMHDLLAQRAKEQEKLNKEAEKLGLPAGKVKPIEFADVVGVAMAAAERMLLGGKSAIGLTQSFSEYGQFNAQKAAANYVSKFVPALPAYQELARAGGVDLDPKIASTWDFMVPMPTSQARAVNFLGDPVGTTDSLQRIIQTFWGGNYPGTVSEGDVRDRAAYSTVFETGYRPPLIDPNKGYAIDGEYRPMTDAELAKYTLLRGQNLKQELVSAGPGISLKEAHAAYNQANQAALQELNVDTSASHQPAQASTATGASSILPGGSPTRFVPPGTQQPTRASGGGRGSGRLRGISRIGAIRGTSGRMRTARGPSLRRGTPFRAVSVRSGASAGRSLGTSRSLRPRH